MGKKRTIKKLVPKQLSILVWNLKIQTPILNTYALESPQLFTKLSSINDSKYEIREIRSQDSDTLRTAYDSYVKGAFKKKIPRRLKSPDWVGLGVFDLDTGELAYLAWIIVNSIKYFEEFDIYLKKGEFLLKDGLCFPKYRHQGLHTRMEEERINYCVKRGAQKVYIQIQDENVKGKTSVINNGYVLIKKNKVLFFPLFNIYREYKSALKRPFRKVIN
ncbi:MAG: hypothetical protein C0594_06705 [Marinilabiliales bacterium]|nr:MAG: hypothetical protein C0594_06705 [Marinilabiliales bacterium]